MPDISTDNRSTERPRGERGTGSIDAIDRAIIRLLQRDGRMSNTEIGRTLDLTETTIRKRIARMLAEDVISIVAVPSPPAIGQTTSAIIGVSVSLGDLQAISESLKQSSEVRYVALSTGRYDIIVEAFFEDNEHLLTFLADKLGSHPGVKQVETSVILKVAKLSYEWEI